MRRFIDGSCRMRPGPSAVRARPRARLAARASRRVCRRFRLLAPAIEWRAVLNALPGRRWLRALDELARASAPPSLGLVAIERRADRNRTRRARFD
ncbi:hypothetical protein [Burkholderia sp. MSMB1588]|nr:hypothetical protein [Burkholderia sp. MSMB1588]